MGVFAVTDEMKTKVIDLDDEKRKELLHSIIELGKSTVNIIKTSSKLINHPSVDDVTKRRLEKEREVLSIELEDIVGYAVFICVWISQKGKKIHTDVLEAMAESYHSIVINIMFEDTDRTVDDLIDVCDTYYNTYGYRDI